VLTYGIFVDLITIVKMLKPDGNSTVRATVHCTTLEKLPTTQSQFYKFHNNVTFNG